MLGRRPMNWYRTGASRAASAKGEVETRLGEGNQSDLAGEPPGGLSSKECMKMNREQPSRCSIRLHRCETSTALPYRHSSSQQMEMGSEDMSSTW